MKKATCVTFEETLNTLHQKGITTIAALMANQQLYDDFWLSAWDYAKFCLSSKNGKTTKKGKQLSGNITKVDILEARGITTRDDIAMDCVVRMVKYAENILQKPTVAHMKNYAYAIVNSTVNTICRNLPPDDFKIVPLEDTIERTGVVEEDAYTYEDIIADYTYNPEHKLIECETIKELEEVLRNKQLKEQAEKEKAILNEIALLCKRPAEVLCRLGVTHLGIKPRDLAARIVDEGCDITLAKIIFEVAEQNCIELSQIRNIIANHELTTKSLKADTNSVKLVAGQISRLVYRADKHLDK